MDLFEQDSPQSRQAELAALVTLANEGKPVLTIEDGGVVTPRVSRRVKFDQVRGVNPDGSMVKLR